MLNQSKKTIDQLVYYLKFQKFLKDVYIDKFQNILKLCYRNFNVVSEKDCLLENCEKALDEWNEYVLY